MTTLFGKGFKSLALSAALLISLSARADATSLTWDLSNVFFDDGTQATGSITFFSLTSLEPVAWDVTVAHFGEFFQFTFNPADSDFTFTSAANLMDPEIDLIWNVFNNTFHIVLDEFTLPATGTVDLATRSSPFVDARGFQYTSYEQVEPIVNFSPQRLVVSGSLVAESGAPEPSTWILAGGVLLTLAAWKRKRGSVAPKVLRPTSRRGLVT